MSTQHTPGPWSVQDMSDMLPDDPYWIGSEHPIAGFCSFASVRLGCTEAGELGDMKANARLIAAAPELLAFAESVEALLSHAQRNGLHLDLDKLQILQDASAVIAKATTP
ncbi:hypothetical protein QTI05_22570 [Variovorax sp. J22R193]|uniref:hypothetical protein n=1 Tax=Variovorax fucosicus TaxID=3053517 RepID=UPI002577FB41|nr:hypothetical protein [Variovorax sp. J22R193]MDM0041842.1 hypothetical protein [Variovorax sp. J22R193]